MNVNRKFLHCLDYNCKSNECTASIESIVNDISKCLIEAGNDTLKVKRYNKNKASIKGWNEYVKQSHNLAREAFLEWRWNGKPKHGALADNMRRYRANFKYILRACKKRNERKESDRLAQKLLSKDPVDFWREIKRLIMINHK